MAYHRQQGVDTAIVRIFNTYGPRMRPFDGRAIPTFVAPGAGRAADHGLRGRQPDALVLLRQRPDQRPDRARRVRATTSRSTSATPTSSRCSRSPRPCSELTESKSPIVYAELPVDDPKQRRPDISLAQELLGWSPEVSLRDGLSVTLGVG